MAVQCQDKAKIERLPDALSCSIHQCGLTSYIRCVELRPAHKKGGRAGYLLVDKTGKNVQHKTFQPGRSIEGLNGEAHEQGG